MNYIFSCNCIFILEPLEHALLYTLGQHGAISRWQIAAKHARVSRLQEKKLKVRPRNVNNTRRARRGDSCFRARHRLEERGVEGCARRWKAKKRRRKKRKKETRADRIPSCGRTRINQTKIEIGKTKPSHSSVNRIEISDLVGLVAMGLVPDPITATRPPASLPTDYRLQTILYERLWISTDCRAGAARCTRLASRRRCRGSISAIVSSRAPSFSAFLFLHVITRNFPGEMAQVSIVILGAEAVLIFMSKISWNAYLWHFYLSYALLKIILLLNFYSCPNFALYTYNCAQAVR